VNGVGKYTILVTNTSTTNKFTDPIIITDILPSNLHYKNFGGNGWSCNGDGKIVCTNDTDITPTKSFTPADYLSKQKI